MKFTKVSFIVLFVLCCAFLIPGAVSAAPTLYSTNGHYYEGVCSPLILWEDAKVAAQGMSYNGATGHLATITDVDENDFVFNLIKDQDCIWVDHDWYGLSGPWLGGSDSQQEATWAWVTGEPWSYSNWMPPEPNDAYPGSGGEDYLHFNSPPGSSENDKGKTWNDAGFGDGIIKCKMNGYVVEYEPPFNEFPVPEFPSTILPATMIIGFLGAVLLIQRTREH